MKDLDVEKILNEMLLKVKETEHLLHVRSILESAKKE